MTSNEPTNPITVEKVNGKEYFHRENNFHCLIFHNYDASRNYPYLEPSEFREEWEWDEEEKEGNPTYRDMENVHLPMLLDDNGEEIAIEQVLEIYLIDSVFVKGSSFYRDNEEEESYHWEDGIRNDEPFSEG